MLICKHGNVLQTVIVQLLSVLHPAHPAVRLQVQAEEFKAPHLALHPVHLHLLVLQAAQAHQVQAEEYKILHQVLHRVAHLVHLQAHLQVRLQVLLLQAHQAQAVQLNQTILI